jgi:hypothetical protein
MRKASSTTEVNMNRSNHTPGPWSAVKCYLNPTNANTIVSENGTAVCSIEVGMKATGDAFEGREGEFVANANLIAAAPELLEAIKAARDVLATAIRANWEGATDEDIGQHVTIKRLDDAIAKATGSEA